MYSPALLGLSLAAFIPTVLSTSAFSQPPGPGPAGNYRDNPVYEVGEKIDMQWSSDLETMDLLLWQEYPNAGNGQNYYWRLLENSRSTSMIWTVSFDGFSTDVAEGESAIFYLALYESGTNNVDVTCHYFNVTLPEEPTTTTSTISTETIASTNIGTMTAKVTPTPDAASTTTTSSSSTATSTSDPKPSPDSLSTGAVAGIAVGSTLGGILALGGLGFLAWKYFLRKRDSGGQYAPGQQVPPEENKHELAGTNWIHPPQGVGRVQGPGGLYEAP
ncbi:hypothetical protein G7Z17_g10872 [Cylindrodendrum hubeiense]|uniref:Uncharacterized protein n=1 Tax=Cylindrodendrum hubeiense TaxID=595255 RepID=A0A9P5LAT6_9HYPO|nr:hypothetical protein G7Z17_g10872 [Cylindrodendrum hubeiense]